MTFYKQLKKYQGVDFNSFWSKVKKEDIARALNKESLKGEDFLVLLSAKAANYLEIMAEKAHQLTVQHFGKIITIYTPLYLANHCENNCLYCSFNINNKFSRKKLTLKEVAKEAQIIRGKGIHHILILTGESRQHTPLSYIKDCVMVLKEHFSAIGIEIYPLERKEYRELIEIGVDSLTIYQEVYDEKTYHSLHLKGPKKDYHYRLNTPERACQAGMRKVNIGALLGLNNWRQESFLTGLHAQYLQNKYLESEISLSLPRLQAHLGSFKPQETVKDRNLVQILLALRLFLPRLGINLSTRENSQLRGNLLPLGITKMSAESKTKVGPYTTNGGVSQFAISDERSVEEIKEMLFKKGYQAVFKDWHMF